MVRLVGFVLVALALLVGVAPAQADGIVVPAVDSPWPGKIFVAHDEWALTDFAFQKAPTDSRALVLNVAAWFTGGRPGRFLAYSTNKAYQGPVLAQTLRNAGHTWTVSKSAPFTLQTLVQYDAVFVGGDEVDNTVLIDYVRAGGSVYLVGGTGLGGVWEASHWNPFLNAFGLNMVRDYNLSRAAGLWPIASDSPLLQGVSRLYESTGNPLTKLDADDLNTQILAWSDPSRGHGLYAIYDAHVVPVSAEICPTRINTKTPGILTVSIAGSPDLDVRTIDPQSLDLFGAVVRSSHYDHSTATRPGLLLAGLTLLACGDSEPDEHLDLILTFDGRTVLQGIERALGRSLRDGEKLALTLTGNLAGEHGGYAIVGEALVEINKPKLLFLF
jgi:hypothetical protein